MKISIIFIIIAAILFPVTGHGQSESCDTIFWSPAVKLSSSDFRASRDTHVVYSIFSFVKTDIRISAEEPAVSATTYFLPCRSWSTNDPPANIIEHGHLHFDIAEYYKRLFIKKVSESSFDGELYVSIVRAMFRANADQRAKFEQDYDRETLHGIKPAEQLIWKEKIRKGLEETSAFASGTVKLNIR